MRTLGNKVAVERIAAEKVSAGGIVLQRTNEPDKAKVLSIGPLVDEVEIGDVLLVNWNTAVKVEGETYVLPVTEVIWVYENE